jgi:uncharacterized protein (DUF433 family)
MHAVSPGRRRKKSSRSTAPPVKPLSKTPAFAASGVAAERADHLKHRKYSSADAFRAKYHFSNGVRGKHHVAYNRDVAKTFDRITQNPNVLAGRATLRGLRISVAHVVSLIANGMTPAQIVADLPDLEEKDVREALAYAAASARNEDYPTLGH